MNYDFLSSKSKKFPDIVHIETTNVCNLSCIHCPHSDTTILPNYKPRFMDIFTFNKIINEISKHNGIVRITPDGEPLIHPDWVKQINNILDSNVSILGFNTNGMLMEKEKMTCLLQKSNVKVVVEFSIDSLYKNSFERIRKGNYVLLMKNIFNFINEKEKLNNSNIKVLVSCINQPEIEEEELEEFIRFWDQVVDKVIIRDYKDEKGLMPFKDKVQNIPQKRWPCPYVYTRLTIGIDGKISYCPMDWLKEGIIDNINRTTIEDVWQSEFYNKLRHSHQSNIYDNYLCNKCNDWVGVKWGYDYVKVLSELGEI